jgi:signal transduction histidine kinase
VRVSVGTKGASATLTVEDTGVGIPEEHQTRLFERFYRADPARARATGGYGLGLAICETIVAAHGGTITFESAPGKGSTFTVMVPRLTRPG